MVNFASNSIECAVARKAICLCMCLYQLLLRLSVVGQFGQFPPFLDDMEADVSNLMTLMFLI
jgi:hypothetical protein